MYMQPISRLVEALDPNLTMRTIAGKEDVEKVAEFNAAIHGPELAPMTRSLLLDYPGMEPADQVFVEDENGIVSALCLIPWTLDCEGTRLQAGELAIVGTAEEYRRRGLVRTQVAYFKRRLRERGCVLSHIQGIPHYYRQFGYQYALPLEGGYRMEFRHIPGQADGDFALRAATEADAGALSSLYDESMRELTFRTERSEAVWEYLISRDDEADGMYHDTWVVVGPSAGDAHLLGYFRVPRFHFGDELVIDEAYTARHDVALWILDRARKLAQERELPGVRLNLPASSYLVRLAMAHEAIELGTYSWQIHVPDDAGLLRAMSPVLEKRLSESAFAGWTGKLRISFYTRALELVVVQGSLRQIADVPATDDCEVKMPYGAFVPLVTGHRAFEELRSQFADASVHGSWRLLLDTLFPKRNSFLHTAY